jgi:hypothetical protein
MMMAKLTRLMTGLDAMFQRPLGRTARSLTTGETVELEEAPLFSREQSPLLRCYRLELEHERRRNADFEAALQTMHHHLRDLIAQSVDLVDMMEPAQGRTYAEIQEQRRNLEAAIRAALTETPRSFSEHLERLRKRPGG